MTAALLLGLPALPGNVSAADTISFSERLTQTLECNRECEPEVGCETFCEERTRISQSIQATLTLPAVRHLDFSDFVGFSLTLGNQSVYPDESSTATSNRIVFPSYHTDEFSEKRRKVGQIIFSKKGDVVTVSASYSAPESTIVADQFTDDSGVQTGDVNIGEVNFQLSIGDVFVEKMIPYSARTTVTHQTRKVDEEFSEEYDFSSVQVSGSASWGNPAVTITHPLSGQRWSNEVITITGTATSTTDVTYVVVQVSRDSDPIPVFATNGLWELDALPMPGTNQLRVYCLDTAGSYSASATANFVYVRTSPLALQINPGLEAGSVLGATNTQLLEEGVTYTLTPKPAPYYLFEKWAVDGLVNGSYEQLESPGDKLSFVHETNLVITAFFVTNRFLPIEGSYAGLLDGTGDPQLPDDLPSLGYFTLQLTKTGQFTGKVQAGKYRRSFKGKADPRLGTAEIFIGELNSYFITLHLNFDLEGGSVLHGTLTDNASWQIDVTGYRTASPAEVAPFVGKHTFLIPGVDATNAAALPAGDGAGWMTVAASGLTKITGTAGDGTAFTQSVPLCKDTSNTNGAEFVLPFHSSARKGRNTLSGFIEASTTNGTFVASPLHWIKQPVVTDPYYPEGFTDDAFSSIDQAKRFVAARYLAPGRGTNAVNWTEGNMLIDGGNLAATLSHQVTVALNRFTVMGDNLDQLTLKLTPGTGLLNGTFLHPSTGRKVKFKGALLQSSPTDGSLGGGWFLGTSESGYIRLTPAGAP